MTLSFSNQFDPSFHNLIGSRVKHVIFDFFGTIVTEKGDLTEVTRNLIKYLEEATGVYYQINPAHCLEDACRVVLGIDPQKGPLYYSLAEGVNELLEQAELETLETSTFLPGWNSFLHRLIESGIQVSVISNNGPKVLEALGILPSTSGISRVSHRTLDFEWLKPNPATLLRSVSDSGIPSDSTLFVGNSFTDLHTTLGRVPLFAVGPSYRTLVDAGARFGSLDYTCLLAS